MMSLSVGSVWRRWAGLAVMGLVLLLPLACRKQPFLDTVMQTPYLGLPGGLDHLASLDMRRFRELEFVRQAAISMQKAPGRRSDPAFILEKTGFDPMQDVDLWILGARKTAANAPHPMQNVVLIARGKFTDPGDKLERLRNWLAEEYLISPPPFKESKHSEAGYSKYSLEAHSQYNEAVTYSLNFCFPNENLMVFSFSPNLLSETLDVIAGQSEGLRKDQAWMAMLQRPNTGAVIWGTGNVNPAAMAGVSPGGVNPLAGVQQYFINIDVGTRFNARLGLVCDSPEKADTVQRGLREGLAVMKQQLGVLSMFLPETTKLPDNVAMLPKGAILEVLLDLNEQKTNALRQEWRRFAEQVEKGNNPFLPGGAPTPAPAPAPAQ